MNNLRANHERILEVLRKISTDQQLPFQRRRPPRSDIEVISLNLTAEYRGIDSEINLFRILPPCFKSGIEHTVFNRRKRRLVGVESKKLKVPHSAVLLSELASRKVSNLKALNNLGNSYYHS